MATTERSLHMWPTHSVEGFPESSNLMDKYGKQRSENYEASSCGLYQEVGFQKVTLVFGSLFIACWENNADLVCGD